MTTFIFSNWIYPSHVEKKPGNHASNTLCAITNILGWALHKSNMWPSLLSLNQVWSSPLKEYIYLIAMASSPQNWYRFSAGGGFPTNSQSCSRQGHARSLALHVQVDAYNGRKHKRIMKIHASSNFPAICLQAFLLSKFLAHIPSSPAAAVVRETSYKHLNLQLDQHRKLTDL